MRNYIGLLIILNNIYHNDALRKTNLSKTLRVIYSSLSSMKIIYIDL